MDVSVTGLTMATQYCVYAAPNSGTGDAAVDCFSTPCGGGDPKMSCPELVVRFQCTNKIPDATALDIASVQPACCESPTQSSSDVSVDHVPGHACTGAATIRREFSASDRFVPHLSPECVCAKTK